MNCDKWTTVCLVGDNLDCALFKLAIEAATKGRRVWFISVKPFEKVPTENQLPSKQQQPWPFCHNRYLNDFAVLMKHLNGIHKWKHLPTVIVLKNFDKYCSLHEPVYSSKGTAFLISTLLNCMSFLCKKQNCRAVLLLSCFKGTHNEAVLTDRLKVLYDMYFDYFFPPTEDTEGLLEKIRTLGLLH